MLRLYSKGCEYAIRGLQHFPRNQERASIHDVCRKARIPIHFARKMFRALVAKGILKGITGPRGGFFLARAPEQINLRQVIEAIDGSDAFQACVMGRSACRSEKPCAMHETWIAAKDHLLPKLEATSLLALMRMGPKDTLFRRGPVRRSPS